MAAVPAGPRIHSHRPPRYTGSVLQLDIFPEPDPVIDVAIGWQGSFIGPRGAGARALAVGDVVELHAVRATQVAWRFARGLQVLHAHGGAREIRVTRERDDVVAPCNDLAVPAGLHSDS